MGETDGSEHRPQQTLWVDVTRTMCWHGTPVGIMRVEFELAKYYLGVSSDITAKFLAFCFLTRRYYEIDRDELRSKLRLIERPLPSATKLSKLTLNIFKVILPSKINKIVNKKKKLVSQVLENLRLIFKKRVTFIHSEMLLIAGPSWTYPGFSKQLAYLKHKIKLKIYLVIYDLIPIFYEHVSTVGAKKQHSSFYQNLFNIIDIYLCISKQTEKDLLRYASCYRQPIKTAVIPLGADFCADIAQTDTCEKYLNKLGIQQPFILFVSTIEARKNHIVLYKAYQLLLEDGHKDIPLMVWVGRPGWGTQDLLHELSNNVAMKGKILILHEVSDATLSRLYRDCLYTLYPSLYEGWGLPVAESLGRGKFCLSSSAASLPEVGQGLTMLLNPYDTRAWADAILRLQDSVYLEQCVWRVKQTYQPKTWQITGKALDVALKCDTDFT